MRVKDVRAAEMKGTEFPSLLDPVDDLPPATMITSVQPMKGKLLVQGVTQDNGEIASVTVTEQSARILSTHAGVVDWETTLDSPRAATARWIEARVVDRAGNAEKTGHSWELPHSKN